MKANVETLREKYAELGEALSQPDVLNDQAAYRKLTRAHSRVGKQLAIGERWMELTTQVEENQALV